MHMIINAFQAGTLEIIERLVDQFTKDMGDNSNTADKQATAMVEKCLKIDQYD